MAQEGFLGLNLGSPTSVACNSLFFIKIVGYQAITSFVLIEIVGHSRALLCFHQYSGTFLHFDPLRHLSTSPLAKSPVLASFFLATSNLKDLLASFWPRFSGAHQI